MATAKVLILGATGMLGSTLLKLGAGRPGIDVIGAIRRPEQAQWVSADLRPCLRSGFDATRPETASELIDAENPDVVINAVGVIKQREAASQVLATLPINSLFPHQLAEICVFAGARVVQISTDCVFSGKKGGYRERDIPDARDVYGLSKYLGELHEAPHVTLRTSIIGPELGVDGRAGVSLLDWFLGQTGRICGYRGAVFSGLPSDELSRVIYDIVLARPDLTGLWHVSAEPINKYDLLTLARNAYGKEIEIEPVDTPRINRSLDSTRFRSETGYTPPAWPELIAAMRAADERPRPAARPKEF